ncbi:unnamed protein product [Allacma fusca]|uniref:Uncharacterized protein n=1 Tax=Allacma fusca TaxID=39272 RepID=A0A8J2Q4S8_9HEXA|nr:unnamed protein product [Allacma fusca]
MGQSSDTAPTRFYGSSCSFNRWMSSRPLSVSRSPIVRSTQNCTIASTSNPRPMPTRDRNEISWELSIMDKVNMKNKSFGCFGWKTWAWGIGWLQTVGCLCAIVLLAVHLNHNNSQDSIFFALVTVQLVLVFCFFTMGIVLIRAASTENTCLAQSWMDSSIIILVLWVVVTLAKCFKSTGRMDISLNFAVLITTTVFFMLSINIVNKFKKEMSNLQGPLPDPVLLPQILIMDNSFPSPLLLNKP